MSRSAIHASLHPNAKNRLLKFSTHACQRSPRASGLTEGRSKAYSRPHMVSRLLYSKQTGMVYSSWNPVHESTNKSVIYSLVDHDLRLQDELPVNPIMQLRDVQSLWLSRQIAGKPGLKDTQRQSRRTRYPGSHIWNLNGFSQLLWIHQSPIKQCPRARKHRQSAAWTTGAPSNDHINVFCFQDYLVRRIGTSVHVHSVHRYMRRLCCLRPKDHLCLPLPSTGIATLHVSFGNSPASIDSSMLSEVPLCPLTLMYSPSDISTLEIITTATRTGGSPSISSGSTSGR
jgi:hypothetical protein